MKKMEVKVNFLHTNKETCIIYQNENLYFSRKKIYFVYITKEI